MVFSFSIMGNLCSSSLTKDELSSQATNIINNKLLTNVMLGRHCQIQIVYGTNLG